MPSIQPKGPQVISQNAEANKAITVGAKRCMQTSYQGLAQSAPLKRFEHDEVGNRQTACPAHAGNSDSLAILASGNDQLRILRLLQSQIHSGLFAADSGKKSFQLRFGEFPLGLSAVSWHAWPYAVPAQAPF